MSFGGLCNRVPVWLLLAASIAISTIQPQTIAGQSSSPLVIRSSTELVQVTVVVTGKKGVPVADLSLKDFQIKERGEEKPISSFENNSVADGFSSAGSVPHLAAFSNSSLTSNKPLTVLFLDASNTDRKNWELAWPQIRSFLGGLPPDRRIAVYSLDPQHGLKVLQDYDSGHERLMQLLKQTHATISTLLNSPSEGVSQQPSFAKRDDELTLPEFLGFGRIRGLTAAFQTIATHLNGIPGPKSMIWFASSFPDPFDRPSGGENRLAEAFRLQLLRAFNDLVSGDVAVYPVDGRGVIPDHSFDAENQFISSGPRTATLIPYDFTAPLQFASRSGGRAYFDTNGFSQSFGDVVSLGNGSYTLGFYESERADDKFHALKVSVNRDDVKLRYRPGYWRFAAPLRSQTEANAQLLLALDSPFTGSEIRLQVNAVRIPSASHLSITLYIDPLDALLNKQGDKWTGSFQIFCGQRDSRNRVFAVAPREVPLEIPDRVRASGQWLQWKIPIALRKDSKVVRIAVLDDASFRIGSVDVPLESVQ